ncbi:hypothetical protein GDO86_004655 [Hymenochirus boettgeri]|uniref:Uncharacterized protein n=1 Tax=Hymenochirus boettgeri TaxID=247094 RepID=A0A8T2K602_9PIPI|nr:hypothetical protein GDO86_004655 [Hymenochirus boettgeri]
MFRHKNQELHKLHFRTSRHPIMLTKDCKAVSLCTGAVLIIGASGNNQMEWERENLIWAASTAWLDSAPWGGQLLTAEGKRCKSFFFFNLPLFDIKASTKQILLS